MKTTIIRLSWVALFITGCMNVKSTSVSIGTDGMVTNNTGLVLPLIQLVFSGASIQGLQSAFFWEASDGKSSFGAENLIPDPPNYPNILVAQVGQSVDIVVTSADFPSALVITEFDTQDIAITSSVFQPTANITLYLLTTAGQYFLQVTAKWPPQDYVTFNFKVNIAP
jgi:hypothetical protein